MSALVRQSSSRLGTHARRGGRDTPTQSDPGEDGGACAYWRDPRGLGFRLNDAWSEAVDRLMTYEVGASAGRRVVAGIWRQPFRC